VPVVASTAWQMLFSHAQIGAGTLVLVLGGNGNVGGFAVQLAHNVGARVIAIAGRQYRGILGTRGKTQTCRAIVSESVPPQMLEEEAARKKLQSS
jgi:NADPH:quinone reductase-like Zn-dependent oxidoreductase